MVRDPEQRTMHYRRFPHGIEDMKVFTADDCVALLQQLPYVVGDGNAVIPHLQGLLNTFKTIF